MHTIYCWHLLHIVGIIKTQLEESYFSTTNMSLLFLHECCFRWKLLNRHWWQGGAKNLRGMFLNADSLTNKLPELEYITKDYMPHIIGINEVLPKNFSRKIYPEEFNLQDYEMITHPNVEKNVGRGSLLYIHKSISYKQIDIKIGNHEFEEALFAEIELSGSDKLLCACLYRRGESNQENNELLLNTIRKISDIKYSHLLLMGDLNMRNID